MVRTDYDVTKNLSFRYRVIYKFEKEEYYLNLALDNLNIDHPNYYEYQKRSLEIGQYFDYNKGSFITIKSRLYPNQLEN